MGHMTRQVNRRPYDATRRRANSRETRNRILATAREAIIKGGYRGATVAQIAAGAEVNIDTVYELVGRKPLILRELIERAISGADEAIVAEDRGYVHAIQAEPDPHAKLSIYAKAVCSIQGRLAPLHLALRDASKTEPEAHEIWKEISDRRASNMRKLARDLSRAGGLRKGLTISEAADILWATNSSELYVLLTVDRKWSVRRYERWLSDTWRRLLLCDI
jgi:AcrR family transcriptional regulator